MSEKHHSQTLGEEFVAATLEGLERDDAYSGEIDLEMLIAGFTTLIALVIFYAALAGYSADDVIAFLRNEEIRRPEVMRLPTWAYLALCGCAGGGVVSFLMLMLR